jgi:hypothetical protein
VRRGWGRFVFGGSRRGSVALLRPFWAVFDKAPYLGLPAVTPGYVLGRIQRRDLSGLGGQGAALSCPEVAGCAAEDGAHVRSTTPRSQDGLVVGFWFVNPQTHAWAGLWGRPDFGTVRRLRRSRQANRPEALVAHLREEKPLESRPSLPFRIVHSTTRRIVFA